MWLMEYNNCFVTCMNGHFGLFFTLKLFMFGPCPRVFFVVVVVFCFFFLSFFFSFFFSWRLFLQFSKKYVSTRDYMPYRVCAVWCVTSSYSNSFHTKTVSWRFKKKIHSGDRFRKSAFSGEKNSPFSKISPQVSMSTSPGVGNNFGSIINNPQR